jgi:hypothetical protein
MTIPRVHRILPIFCAKLLKNRTTSIGPNKERTSMEMGPSPTQSVRGTQNVNVLQPSIDTTKL